MGNSPISGQPVINTLFVLAALLLWSGQGVAVDDEDENQFVDHWFALIDQKEFDRAWDEMATTSQKEWSKDYWLFSLKYFHEQIGGIESRYLSESRIEHDSLGDISSVVLTYQSNYASLTQATEIVRIGKESGLWKLISYELKNPASDLPIELYASRDACEESFALEGQRPFVDQNSEPVVHLTALLNGVATGKYSEVERFRIIADQATLDEWRRPQCFRLSRVIDVRNLYPNNLCFGQVDLVIEVLEKRPDDIAYYSLRHDDGEWEISGFRSKGSFESCLSREWQ